MNISAPNNEDPDRSDIIVIGSGTAELAAENANSEAADGSCVVKLKKPGD